MLIRNAKGQFIKGCEFPNGWNQKNIGKVETKCQYCDKVIIDYKVHHRKYCSKACFCKDNSGENNHAWVSKYIQHCLICGKEIIATSRDLEKGTKKFCSKECHGIFIRGKPGHRLNIPCSEETKEKLRKVNKGQHRSPTTEFKKGHVPANKGQSPFQSTKDKIGKANTGKKPSNEARRKMREAKLGNKSFLWIDGRSKNQKRQRNNVENKIWRETNFEKDNYTCRKCGIRSKKKVYVYLEAHYIYNWMQYPELRYGIDNGITFCKDCHKAFHKKYGQRNNNQKQLEEFIGKKLNTKVVVNKKLI